MNAPTRVNPRPIGEAARRQSARIGTQSALAQLLDVAGLLDGLSPTAHSNALHAITVVDTLLDSLTVLDSLPGHNESRAERMDEPERLRRWAEEHGENCDELKAEARGEC